MSEQKKRTKEERAKASLAAWAILAFMELVAYYLCGFPMERGIEAGFSFLLSIIINTAVAAAIYESNDI